MRTDQNKRHNGDSAKLPAALKTVPPPTKSKHFQRKYTTTTSGSIQIEAHPPGSETTALKTAQQPKK